MLCFVCWRYNSDVCCALRNYHLNVEHYPRLLKARFDQTANLLITSVCLPAFIARDSDFLSSGVCLLAQVK